MILQLTGRLPNWGFRVARWIIHNGKRGRASCYHGRTTIWWPSDRRRLTSLGKWANLGRNRLLDDLHIRITQVWFRPRMYPHQPKGRKDRERSRLVFHASNNYEDINNALRIALEIGVEKVELFTDLKLLSSQSRGTYNAKDERMGAYLDIVRSLAHRFTSLIITQKPRNDIRHADALAYLAAAMKVDSPRSITVELQ